MENFDEISQEREEGARRVLRFLDEKNIHGEQLGDVCAREEGVREFIEHLSVEDFLSFVNELNGTIRGLSSEHLGMTPRSMEISGALDSETVFAPRAEDREELFSAALKAVQKMNEDRRSREDIALLLSITLNTVHPWEDANGRTSRIFYTLIADGGSAQLREKMKMRMSEEGSDDVTTDVRSISGDLSQILKDGHGVAFSHVLSDVPSRDFTFKEGVDDQMKSYMIRAYKTDAHFDFAIAVSDFLNEKGSIDEYIKDFPNEMRVVMLDALTPVLSGNDVQKIMETYENIKKEKVLLFIDAVANPDNEAFRVKTKNGDEVRLLDKLKARMVRM